MEVHFYLAIGIAVTLAGRRALWMIPIGFITITVLSASHGVHASIVTHYRVDEILGGATLGLLTKAIREELWYVY